MSPKITREQAEKALAAVKAQWAAYLEPLDYSGHKFAPEPGEDALRAHLIDAHGYDDDMLARKADKGQTLAHMHAADHAPTVAYPEPVLVEDYTDSGHWAIAWEEGPDDWAYLIGGGTSEADHVTYAALSAEFGRDVAPPVRAAAQMPADVYAEPIMSFVLGLYPA